MTLPLLANTVTYGIWWQQTNQIIGIINQLTDGVLTVNGSIVFTNSQFFLSAPAMNIANVLALSSPSGNALTIPYTGGSVNGTLYLTGAGNGLVVSNNVIINKNISANGIDIGSGLQSAFTKANAAFNPSTALAGQLNGYLPNPVLASGAAITNIGFTPVQSGGGVGQGNNKIYLGWDGYADEPRVQIDSTDWGWILGANTTFGYLTTPSRTYNTLYTNTSKRPIFVSIVSTVNNSGSATQLYINGLLVSSNYGTVTSYTYTVSGIIPLGGTYAANTTLNTPTLTTWVEY